MDKKELEQEIIRMCAVIDVLAELVTKIEREIKSFVMEMKEKETQ